jgi:predicted negative regulator of RcsB-dependent stress response
LYAVDSALMMAKVAVDQGQLEEAAAELSWVMDKKGKDPIGLVARLRLAQVQYAQADYTAALATLTAADAAEFNSAYEELRGDIYSAMADHEQAQQAYQLALDTLLTAQNDRRDIIEMKLNDIRSTANVDQVESEAEVDGEAHSE